MQCYFPAYLKRVIHAFIMSWLGYRHSLFISHCLQIEQSATTFILSAVSIVSASLNCVEVSSSATRSLLPLSKASQPATVATDAYIYLFSLRHVICICICTHTRKYVQCYGETGDIVWFRETMVLRKRQEAEVELAD